MTPEIQAMTDDKKRDLIYLTMMEAAPLLLPCPFCGNGAHYSASYYTVRTEAPDKILGGVWVSCDQCYAELGRGGWDSMEKDNGEFDAFTAAAAAWNTRPKS